MNWKELMSPIRFGDRSDPRNDELRSRFDQDYDRVIFSHPFRKLQDKTQVFPLPEDDFVHTRLTHSLEVSTVGRSLGKQVGKAVIEKYNLGESQLTTQHFGSVVAAACLAHDIGNPPFGHSGEEAISAYFAMNQHGQKFKGHVNASEWEDLINFEGNAQGFSLLNNKAFGGLRLTYATLAAFTKYPKSALAPAEEGRRSQKKFGFYVTNEDDFSALAKAMNIPSLSKGSYLRHPLAFLVEAADDICYSIIDLEDGARLGLVEMKDTITLVGGVIGDKFSRGKLEKIKNKEEKLGILRAMSINQLVMECVDCFLNNEEKILQGQFDRALTDDIPSAPFLRKIIDLSIKKIYRSRQVLEKEAAGFETLEKLMEAFCGACYARFILKDTPHPKYEAIYRLLPDDVQHRLGTNTDVYKALRIIIDFISGLTDKSAMKLYRTIYGYSTPL